MLFICCIVIILSSFRAMLFPRRILDWILWVKSKTFLEIFQANFYDKIYKIITKNWTNNKKLNLYQDQFLLISDRSVLLSVATYLVLNNVQICTKILV